MDADLILFNTCAVREHAEQRVFGNVGALKGLKVKKRGLMIGLCGCMANQKHVVEKLRKSYPYVDLVFGVDGIDTLPQLIAQKLQKPNPRCSACSRTAQVLKRMRSASSGLSHRP